MQKRYVFHIHIFLPLYNFHCSYYLVQFPYSIFFSVANLSVTWIVETHFPQANNTISMQLTLIRYCIISLDYVTYYVVFFIKLQSLYHRAWKRLKITRYHYYYARNNDSILLPFFSLLRKFLKTSMFHELLYYFHCNITQLSSSSHT